MFSFSSSPFSVTMERIEKCAAAYIPKKTGRPPAFTIFDTVMNELSKSRPDFEAIRTELREFAEMLFSFQHNYFKELFDNSWYFLHEGEYSKACLQLLKRPDLPFSDAELALPFMIIDFWRMAADRFSNGEIMALGQIEISFTDAVEFICSLNMPAELRLLLADKENQADFLIGGDETLKVWQTKMAKPRQCCVYCMSELKAMHSLLNHIFGKVSDADLPVPYIPAELEPPYTMDKLFNNLVPASCQFHDSDSALHFYAEESDLQDSFINFLRQLSEIRQDDPRKALKIHDALKICDYESVYQDIRTGEYTDQRYEMEQDYPWCRAYFLWYDAVKAGEDQEDCILPEVLKGEWETELSEFYDRLWEEWNEIAPQAEKGTIHSPEKIRDFFIGKRQAFLDFLQEKTGKDYVGDYDCYPRSLIDDRKDKWIVYELIDIETFVSLFENGVPAPDARIEVIGDYLDEHSWAVKLARKAPPSIEVDPLSLFNVARTYIYPLIDRLEAEMERIASDKSIAVYLRETLLEKIVQLAEKISCRPFSGEEAQKILQKFRKKHKLSEDGSSFSRSFRKIMKMNVVETSHRRAELAETAAAERRKVLFEMSHSIKNLMASVSEPLSMLQEELSGTQRRTVENALAGAGLIRDLAVGVHMSMRGEPGNWRKDIKEPGFGAATLDKIIFDAVRHAVSNMFDGKYFAQFVKNYFGRDLDTFMQAQNEWKNAETAEKTFACINKYFFDFTIDCHDTDLKVSVGDRDGTATKLLILFQELFLNAVKYSSFTERGKRFVKLDIEIMPDKWNVSLSNSAAGRSNAKSSGIGLAVIKNFATLFEAKYDAGFKKDIYTTNMKFFLNK